MSLCANHRARRLATLAAMVLGLSVWSCRVAAVEIDIAATAAKYAASSSDSGGRGAEEMNPTLLVRDQEDYARYVRWQRDYARRGWEWHLFSTQFLFAMVMVIVAFGLWLTHKQFQRDYMPHGVAPSPPSPPTEAALAAATSAVPTLPTPAPVPAPAPSSLKLGPAGLELTSQVVGLLVLAISVAFFYFYVKEVYPMREVERDTAALSSPPAK